MPVIPDDLPPDRKLPFPGLGTDPQSVRRRIEALEKLMERMFVIPGINRPVGLDVILDLVPIAGSTAAAALGTYMAWEARNLGMSKFHLARMAGNVGFDTLVGAIPLAGDLFDLAFRSNTRNLRIVRRWLDKHHPETKVIEGEVLARREI